MRARFLVTVHGKTARRNPLNGNPRSAVRLRARLRLRLVMEASLVAGLLSGACITTTVVNIGQKTSLEKQLMGDLEPLREEEILAASVRSGGSVQAGSIDDLQARAVAARRRQLFNRDDLEELKAAGCVGETRAARLVERTCPTSVAVELVEARGRLLAEENADRATIIDWAVAADPQLTPSDRPEVEELYGRLLREQARPGDWVEQDDGTWQKR